MAKKPPARRKGKSSDTDRWIVVGIIISLVLIALSLWGPLRRHQPAEGDKAGTHRQADKHDQTARPSKEHTLRQTKKEPVKQGPALLGSPAPEKTAFVAVVIDDLGKDLNQAQEVLALPGQDHGCGHARFCPVEKGRRTGTADKHEVLLHLPMEYRGKNGKPAPGMLRSTMTPMEFLNTISEDVDSVPGAIGVNNHEGSCAYGEPGGHEVPDGRAQGPRPDVPRQPHQRKERGLCHGTKSSA